ncbi:hypothetical protein HZS_1335 [Henneguya salminicola]|nr:hypothetical protein HZS_1335 [Henneguya salminicola]
MSLKTGKQNLFEANSHLKKKELQKERYSRPKFHIQGKLRSPQLYAVPCLGIRSLLPIALAVNGIWKFIILIQR